jgi:hypothetical protein
MVYRIAGNFHGVQFSWFLQISDYPRKLESRNKYDCTVYIVGMIACIRETAKTWKTDHLRKLDHTKISCYKMVFT